MKRRSQLAIFGVAVLLASCSGTPKNDQPTDPAIQLKDSSQPVASQPPKAATFANPVVKSKVGISRAKIPGLLQATNPQARAASVATGRRDPFAALSQGPIKLTAAKPVSRPKVSTVPRSQISSLPPLTSTPGALPRVPSGSSSLPPLGSNSTGLPTLPAAPAPVSKTALADAIEVSGAIQVRGKWHVIVKEPGSSSRYVGEGDRLANGKVLVKKILAGMGADPMVVLSQNGVNVTKRIGTIGMSISSVGNSVARIR